MLSFRIRNLSIAVIVVVAGLGLLVVGFQQWQAAQGPLGPMATVSQHGRLAFYPVSDDRYILFLQSRTSGTDFTSAFFSGNEVVVKDTQTGKKQSQHADLDTNLQFEGAANRFLDGHRYLHQDGILDLATGTTASPQWGTAKVQGLRGQRVFLWNQTADRPGFMDVDQGSVPVWLDAPPGRADCFQPGNDPQLVPVDRDSLILPGCPVNSDGTRLQLWHEAIANGTWTALFPSSLEGAARSSNGAAFTATPDHVVVVVRDGGEDLKLRILDSKTWAVLQQVDLGIPSLSDPVGVTASPEGWAVHAVDASVAYSETGESHHMEHLAWGTWAGQRLGLADHDVAVWSAGFTGPTQMTSGGLLTGLDGRIALAHPGSGAFTGAALMVPGLALVVAGATWPMMANRRLQKTSGAGLSRCLHCGARREPGVSFCYKCGWRTGQESKAAASIVNPWDKDR